MELYVELSGRYPNFTYRSYDYRVTDRGLEGRFAYEIRDDQQQSAFEFFTSYSIALQGADQRPYEDIEQLVYTLGLMEAISYWKLTCAPTITIACGHLDKWQQDWWRKLFKKGLSEFFYLNQIYDWDEQELTFVSEGDPLSAMTARTYTSDTVMVPIGGGKDSITSVEILHESSEIIPVMVNAIKASTDLVTYHGLQKYIKISRKLDPQIVQLNAEGFLNGHIPFSAVLSVYTMLAARMYGIKDIALSNESSANEPTIIGTDINHQYSKSMEYEQDITDYIGRYLDKEINYFSLLRPLSEYQITKIFAGADPKLHRLFRSCNRGSKEGIWCTQCPKCLFTYIMMYAHLSLSDMIEIYGHDLLDDEQLSGYFLSLTGQRTEKPFECVGTIEEVNAALAVIKQKCQSDLPKLFQHWSEDLVTVTDAELLSGYESSRLTPRYHELVKEKLASVV